MAEVAVQLARTAQEVLLSSDTGRRRNCSDEDDAVDAEHRHLFTMLIDRKWQNGVCSAVDVALLGRFYERFADHAVEIGRRVVFEATGGLPCTSSSPRSALAAPLRQLRLELVFERTLVATERDGRRGHRDDRDGQ